MRPDPSLLLNTQSTSTPTLVCFRSIVTDSSSGVYSTGCRPSRPEIDTFHDVSNRFGGSHSYRGSVLVRPTTVVRPCLWRSCRSPWWYRGALYRGARCSDSPRPAETASTSPAWPD